MSKSPAVVAPSSPACGRNGAITGRTSFSTRIVATCRTSTFCSQRECVSNLRVCPLLCVSRSEASAKRRQRRLRRFSSSQIFLLLEQLQDIPGRTGACSGLGNPRSQYRQFRTHFFVG